MLVLLPCLLFAAQDGAAPAAPTSRARVQTFIAPSGEPFRVYGEEPYPVAKWFAGADKNGDGKLDYTEFNADFMRFFDVLDADHDGSVDAFEKGQYESKIAPETLGSSSVSTDDGGDDDGGRGFSDFNAPDVPAPKVKYGSIPFGAARFDLLGIPEPVAAMDMQIRGRVSRNDATQSARIRFNVLDPQHHGYLTLDTLPKTFAQSHYVPRAKY
jgi:hypothetical protein